MLSGHGRDTPRGSRLSAWFQRALQLRPGELPLAALGALAYFCVLAGYGFLRPVREAFGVSRGMDELRVLFAITSLSSLVFVLAFGGAISRMDRRRVVPLAYGIVIVCLGAFAALLVADGLAGGALVGSGGESATATGVAWTFYVWLSVVNLFVNSVLWGFLADVFDVEQGKRTFAFIGIGGTLGALAGSWATSLLGSAYEGRLLPVGLMGGAAALFAAAIAVVRQLDRRAVRSAASGLSRRDGLGELRPLGGGTWDGLTEVLRSPYLLGIGGWIVLMAVANTLLYFAQAELVREATDTFGQRVAGFADLDALAQVATLLTQLFVTSRLIRRLGVGWTLALLPVFTLAGFAVLAVWPVLGVMAVFQALHRAARYAVARPARETLFSVVPQAQKYKAKPVVDVFLYRGGDLAGMGLSKALAWAGLGMGALAVAALPLAAAWGALSLALGRAQARRDGAERS
jgi:AAA family ATP:ADP antiporter